MNPKIFTAAGKRVEIASWKMTFLEAIHRSNMAKRVILPNSFHNKMFLSKDGQERFKPAPEGITNALPLYSGTFAVIGAKGERLGSRLETEVDYAGQRKTLIIETEGAPKKVMVCCDQGFSRDGVPHLQLFNAKTGKAVATHEGMLEPSEVILRLNGQTYTFSVTNLGRDGGVLERVGGVDTFIWVPNSGSGGLLERRSISSSFSTQQDIFLNPRPHVNSVAMEAS